MVAHVAVALAVVGHRLPGGMLVSVLDDVVVGAPDVGVRQPAGRHMSVPVDGASQGSGASGQGLVVQYGRVGDVELVEAVSHAGADFQTSRGGDDTGEGGENSGGVHSVDGLASKLELRRLGLKC